MKKEEPGCSFFVPIRRYLAGSADGGRSAVLRFPKKDKISRNKYLFIGPCLLPLRSFHKANGCGDL
ncbi:MAG: hypothetical protein JWP57_3972 [Spirosoma sp.]|nr:hypothetical protein [Spirosoma sp.]